MAGAFSLSSLFLAALHVGLQVTYRLASLRGTWKFSVQTQHCLIVIVS